MQKNDRPDPLETNDKQVDYKALEDALDKIQKTRLQHSWAIQQAVTREKIRGQTQNFVSYVNHAGKLNSADMQRKAAGLEDVGSHPEDDKASRQLVEEILKLLKAGVTKEGIETHSRKHIESIPMNQRYGLIDITIRQHIEMALKEMYPETRATQVPYRSERTSRGPH